MSNKKIHFFSRFVHSLASLKLTVIALLLMAVPLSKRNPLPKAAATGNKK